jgi:uncharacterized protein (DUF1778 family)
MTSNTANKRCPSAAHRPAAKKVLSGKKPVAKKKPVAPKQAVARKKVVAKKKTVAKKMAMRKKPALRKKGTARRQATVRAELAAFPDLWAEKPASAALPAEGRARITARVPAQVRDELERAAEIMGAANVGQFIVQAAVSEAKRIIQSETVIELSARDFHAFAEALQQPPPPSVAMEAALMKLIEARHRDDRADRLDWQPRPRGV